MTHTPAAMGSVLRIHYRWLRRKNGNPCGINHTDLRTAARCGNYGRIVAGHDQCAVRQLQIPGIPKAAAISALCQPLPTQRGKSNISCFAAFHATKRGG